MFLYIKRCLIYLLLPVSITLAADDGTLFNQVHIDAQVERNVENDQLEVSMQVEKQGNKPQDIASEINETMQWGLKLAKSNKDIEVSTRSYQTYPIYKNRLIVGWRATQKLNLKSIKITELTDLVGDLQERLQVKQMNFSPTRQTRARIENELISEAMDAFKQRAEIVKGHMDEKNYRIVDLHVNTGQSGPVMYQEAMMSRAMMSDAMEMAPAVEAGTSKVIVTVSGSIQFF
jgi:predicted secreted protein